MHLVDLDLQVEFICYSFFFIKPIFIIFIPELKFIEGRS